MFREISLTPATGGFGQWQRTGDAGEGWEDLGELLAERRERVAAGGGGEVFELADGAELPAGLADIRGRIEVEPSRVYGRLDGEGEAHYFGIEEA